MQYQTRLNIAEARIKLDESQVSVFTSKFKVMVQNIYYIKAAIKRIQRKLAFFVKWKNAKSPAKLGIFIVSMSNQQINKSTKPIFRMVENGVN